MEERLENITFEGLVSQIERTNDALRNNARLVINRHVTAKAWLTGYYRLFYLTYPQLGSVISDFLIHLPIGQSVISQLLLPSGKSQSVISQLDSKDSNAVTIRQSLIAQFDGVKPEMLFNCLSFTHFAAILPCKDPLQRAFYETMAIRGTWSVRELQRQIESKYYVRSGWSKKPDKLAELVDGKAEKASLMLDIKSPFTFEFLGLSAKDVVEESDLETALLDHLQDFILELGMGFCFEERQKKLLIDDRYFKADLVFYHRILKRHVIIELKANRLDYADTAQLKMYLAYFRKNIMQPDDNTPIGILMCSEIGQEMAEYTLLDTGEDLFISKYEFSLPSKERMTEFLRKENEGLVKE